MVVLSQATKADDDDFQDFQEAPKAGAGDPTFTEFQGDSAGSFPTTIAPQHQNRYSAYSALKAFYCCVITVNARRARQKFHIVGLKQGYVISNVIKSWKS